MYYSSCIPDCHPLFLLKCPHKVFQSGHYIVSYSDDTLFVYSTKTNELAWKWHVGQLRRYSYEPSVPFIEIEAGRSVSCVIIVDIRACQ